MSAFLYLLPLGGIFDLVGYMPPALRLFVIYGLLALPLCLRPSRQSGWLALGLGVVVVARALLRLPPVAETLVLLLAHQAIWTVLAPVPRPLRLGVVAYAFVHLLLLLSPVGQPALETMAAAGNRVLRWIAGQPFHLGPSYLNVGGFLLFLTLSVFSWDRSKVAVARSASFVLVAVLLNALGAVLLLEKADFAASFAWTLKFRDPFGFRELWQHLQGLAVIVYPGFVFLAQLVAYVVLHFGRAAKSGGGEAGAPGWAALRDEIRPGKRWLVMAGAGALAVLVVVPPTSWRRPSAAELVFVDKGIVSFTKPDYQRYGEAAGGMFGMLPEYTRLFGWPGTVVKDIPATLDPKQVLVLTSPNQDMGDETRRRVWDFVAKGGRLWVLGDHTPIHDDRNYLNELLAPCHIAFNNDSAQFFPQGWFHSYRFPQGTPFAALRDDAENRPGILVGASLAVGAPAQPFVLGRFGYGDLGLDQKAGDRGYLGDFKYQPRERLGDLVLAAGERYGQGRVLVFGDTTSFFNNNLARANELLRACLAWLGETNHWSLAASAWGRSLAALLVAGVVVLAFRWRALPVGAAALLAAALVSWATHGGGGWPAIEPSFARAHLAVIDFSHQPNASKHSAMDNGLHGVAINLLRHGELPVAMNEWDPGLVDRARYLVLNAPRRRVTEGERRDLMRFLERGGTVILGCGYLDAAGSRPLLEPLGFRISAVPLGRFFDQQAFGRPVSFMSAWALAAVPENATILCATPDNWPLIASVPVGQGELVLIADSEFLHNRNLEGSKNHDPANTAFLKNLLDSVAP